MFQDETLDVQSKFCVFSLVNEYAARCTVSGDLEKSSIMLDKAQTIINYQGMSVEIGESMKASFYSNLSCYYEK
jgi:hypothetical protein